MLNPRSPKSPFSFDQFSQGSSSNGSALAQQFQGGIPLDPPRQRRMFEFDEASLNETDSSVHTTVISSISDRSNATSLNGIRIPQRDSTGILEDQDGLNPTVERDLGEDF